MMSLKTNDELLSYVKHPGMIVLNQVPHPLLQRNSLSETVILLPEAMRSMSDFDQVQLCPLWPGWIQPDRVNSVSRWGDNQRSWLNHEIETLANITEA